MGQISIFISGQGCVSRMGAQLCEAFPAAREVFEKADRALGFSVSELASTVPKKT
jgi:hypothetical protein